MTEDDVEPLTKAQLALLDEVSRDIVQRLLYAPDVPGAWRDADGNPLPERCVAEAVVFEAAAEITRLRDELAKVMGRDIVDGRE